MSSNQTRPARAAAIFIGGIVVLAVAAWLLAKVWHPAGVLLVAGAFIGCGLTRGRRQRVTHLPRPADAPLPALRDETPLAA